MHRFGSRLGCEPAKVKSLVHLLTMCTQAKLKVRQGGKSLLLPRPAVDTLSTAALRCSPTHARVKVLTASPTRRVHRVD